MTDNDDATVPSVASATNLKKTENQITKLKDANQKYKNLLKMAKERIQTQEEELDNLQGKPRMFSLFRLLYLTWHHVGVKTILY